jgi:hypothetical protein
MARGRRQVLLDQAQSVVASRREISFVREFSGIGLFLIPAKQNFCDMLAKCSEANPKQVSVADSNMRFAVANSIFATREATSFWKRGVLAQWFKHWTQPEQRRS